MQKLAEDVSLRNGETGKLGKNWLQGFLRRNPEVKTLRGKRLDFERANGATTDIIQRFFDRLSFPALANIPPSHRYNMDETGLAIGVRDNGLVLGSSAKRIALKKQSGKRVWSTVIECISATGQILTPLVIFEGSTVQQQWFPTNLGLFNGWLFESTARG